MRLDLRSLPSTDLDAAARTWASEGYLLLDGLEAQLAPLFRRHLARAFGLGERELTPLLDPHAPPLQLPDDVRARLARISPDEELRATLLKVLEPLILRLGGALVHLNTTFHGQFKGGPAPVVDHGGYGNSYAEVQGQYLLHQDFAGANLPTSPSALTLWVPLNDCDEWSLRLYPGSHRKGLLCNRWLDLDDPRLTALRAPVDVCARLGQGALFHALLLHGSSNPGPTRRVSCDMRIFPLCGFLPSPIRTLGAEPLAAHRAHLELADDEILQAPFLETLAWMGVDRDMRQAPPLSVLNWLGLVRSERAGDHAGARAALERFANAGFGADEASAYARFVGRPLQTAPLEELRARLAGREPGAPELLALEQRLAGANARAGALRGN